MLRSWPVVRRGRTWATLCAGWLACSLSVQPARAQVFESLAPVAMLVDMGTGSTLYAKAVDEPRSPASLVKLMTAEIVLREIRRGRITLDTEFVVSPGAWRRGGAPSGGSAMFAAPNSRIRVGDLLTGLIVMSGNDAALALAEGVAGSEEAFVALMNARAVELGLRGTVFRNATGFDHPEQRTTARDMARLAVAVIAAHPAEYQAHFGLREFTWNRVRQVNRNPLVALNIGADGVKTGQTATAGFNLIGSAEQDGRRLIVVVLGAASAPERSAEAQKLLAWGFRSFERRTLRETGAIVGEAQVFGGEAPTVPVRIAAPIDLLVPRGALEQVGGVLRYRGPLLAPVTEGQPVGELVVQRLGIDALEVPVVAAASVAEASLVERARAASLELLRQGWAWLWSQGRAWLRKRAA